MIKRKRKSVEESEEDRETRLINKTVEKIQEIMAKMGYFKPPEQGKNETQKKGKLNVEQSNCLSNSPSIP